MLRSNANRKGYEDSFRKGSFMPPDLEIACDYSQDMSCGVNNVLGVCSYLIWYSLLPLVFLLLPLIWIYFRTVFWIIFGSTTFASLYPLDPAWQPRWGAALGAWGLRAARQYFGIKLCFRNREAIRTCGPAIFCCEPHDILPMGIYSLANCLKLNEPHNNIACMTSAIFRIPFMRHMFTWSPSMSVDKDSLRAVLKKGFSPTICPGGVQEVTYMIQGKDECALYLKKRKGFVKLAMEFGRPIVPMFSFGQRKTYDFLIPRSEFGKWIGRKLGFLPLVFFGQYGIPMFIPKSTPITVVVGNPIIVPKYETINLNELDKYHRMYIAATIDLFESHKVQFGMGTTTIRIV